MPTEHPRAGLVKLVATKAELIAEMRKVFQAMRQAGKPFDWGDVTVTFFSEFDMTTELQAELVDWPVDDLYRAVGFDA
jgi:hypothetical protein